VSFVAEFEFGPETKIVVGQGAYGGYRMVFVGEHSLFGNVPLDEAIPQLERVLETAKMIVNKEAQEATNGE